MPSRAWWRAATDPAARRTPSSHPPETHPPDTHGQVNVDFHHRTTPHPGARGARLVHGQRRRVLRLLHFRFGRRADLPPRVLPGRRHERARDVVRDVRVRLHRAPDWRDHPRPLRRPHRPPEGAHVHARAHGPVDVPHRLPPDFTTIGWLAPILLVLARLMQGLSAAGEQAGASSLSLEHAPDNRRVFFTSWTLTGTQGGARSSTRSCSSRSSQCPTSSSTASAGASRSGSARSSCSSRFSSAARSTSPPISRPQAVGRDREAARRRSPAVPLARRAPRRALRDDRGRLDRVR